MGCNLQTNLNITYLDSVIQWAAVMAYLSLIITFEQISDLGSLTWNFWRSCFVASSGSTFSLFDPQTKSLMISVQMKDPIWLLYTYKNLLFCWCLNIDSLQYHTDFLYLALQWKKKPVNVKSIFSLSKNDQPQWVRNGVEFFEE